MSYLPLLPSFLIFSGIAVLAWLVYRGNGGAIFVRGIIGREVCKGGRFGSGFMGIKLKRKV